MEAATSAVGTHTRHRSWNMEAVLLGLLGLVMVAKSDWAHHLGIVGETIVLVLFLGGLMGVTRIKMPAVWRGKPIPLWVYPIMAGVASAFMDSFLVLLLVAAAGIVGPDKDRNLFKIYVMIAALIGGVMTYFGEVYMLPLALRYGMRSWHSMLPFVVPVMAYLLFLAWKTRKLEVEITSIPGFDSNGNGKTGSWRDYVEFSVGIFLLFLLHNPLLCLGLLFLYASVTGQGEDLIDVIKTETETAVMVLLLIALFVSDLAAPWIGQFTGWWVFVPSTINGVITGALYPATGAVWQEMLILSTAVLITPLSSLVGVMLFKTAKEWKAYVKASIPLALVWFLICGAWFYGPWQWWLDDTFYRFFPRPTLVAEKH